MENFNTKPLAVITGASSGIGYELARECAEHGFDLLLAAEDESIFSAKDVLHSLVPTVHIQSVKVDLATSDGVERLVQTIRSMNRPIEALLLNAGVGVGGAFVGGTDLDEEMNIIRLNVMAPVQLAKHLLPEMVARGQGRVLFTSSIAATGPGPFLAVYAASKAFVQSFAEAICNELKDSGVTVTALMPGATDTHFFARAHMEDTKVGSGPKDDPRLVAKEGFKAMMQGKDHVITGSLTNKFQGAIARVLPETSKAAAQRKMTEPGSAHP